MVPWSHLRQPFSGWVLTVLNSEFTHFNLVIRLRNVQQLAFLFCTFFEISCRSGCPLRSLVNCILCSEKPCWTSETSFLQHFYSDIASCHDTCNRQAHDFQVWFSLLLVLWWGETYCASNSLELGSCFMPLRQDLTTVPVQGIIARQFRHLGTESCFWFCFSLTSSPLVPYLMLSSLPR